MGGDFGTKARDRRREGPQELPLLPLRRAAADAAHEDRAREHHAGVDQDRQRAAAECQGEPQVMVMGLSSGGG